jgi:hypothetical protein
MLNFTMSRFLFAACLCISILEPSVLAWSEQFTMRWDSLFSYTALFGAARAIDCSPSSIQSILPSNASVNFAYSLPANSTFQVPKGDTGYPTSPVGLPALCAVSVQVKSIGNTTFGFGLFLPEKWNERFLCVVLDISICHFSSLIDVEP